MIVGENITVRTGQAIIVNQQPELTAKPEVMVGDLSGSFGQAFAHILGDQSKEQNRFLAMIEDDLQVRPSTVIVCKTEARDTVRFQSIIQSTVQVATAHGVIDAVRSGDIPKKKANELGIIISLWLDPGIIELVNFDDNLLFDIHREATAIALRRAMRHDPSIDWLLERQESLMPKGYYSR